jgi:hypothetical protein
VYSTIRFVFADKSAGKYINPERVLIMARMCVGRGEQVVVSDHVGWEEVVGAMFDVF